MIYIKRDNLYLKYHVTKDGRFICTAPDGSESVILYDVSDEFDCHLSDEGKEHFVIQGLNGELIYLVKDNGTWKKYSIFKSRKGVRKISGIKLAACNDMLCAFYIMEHTGKNLLIKHVFSVNDLYKEPEVLNLTDRRKNFCICHNSNGEIYLFFKNDKGKWSNYILNSDYTIKSSGGINIEDSASNLCALFLKNELYFSYTAQRGMSTALIACCPYMKNDIKPITFGVSKSCRPYLVSYDGLICIQWNENGTVMQSDLDSDSKQFKKPKPLGVPGVIAGIKENKNSPLSCHCCAVYNKYPYIRGKSILKIRLCERENDMNLTNSIKNDITNENYTKEIFSKLKEIETVIDTMGKNLEDMCLFLSELEGFKKEIDNTEISIAESEKKDTLSGGDVGEIDEDNIKLFENTDIDLVLPE